MIDKVDIVNQGGQLIQAAIECGNKELLSHYLKKGCDINSYPQAVTPIETKENIVDYRPAPFAV